MAQVTYPPGTVVIPVGSDQARYHAFTLALSELKKPPGTITTWGRNLSICMSLNNAIEEMPDDHEWLWLMGDDHYFEPDILLRLLARMYESENVDIVAPLCFTHSAPFSWTMRIIDTATGKLIPLPAANTPRSGMVEVTAVGSGGMLIYRKVLDKLGHPWFQNTHPFLPNEDIDFCIRAKQAGFHVWVDLDLPLGHVGTKLVIPAYNDERDEWGVSIDLGMGHTVFSNKINQ